jgi:hypothetical protein
MRSGNSEPSIDFADYFAEKQPRLANDRPQLLEVARRLQSFLLNGKTGDVLNVSMPTRFGKSMISTAFSSWILTELSPRYRILRASYAADLAESFSEQVRNEIEAYFYPKFHGRATRGTRARWKIAGLSEDTHAGCGIDGGITGFGFDLAIIDDTAKNMLEAMSPAYERRLKTFKESVLLGRLEGKKKILNVGTRWTVNDWFSMWPDAEEYVLPAMTEDGRSICEAWKTTEELERERGRVSEGVWNAQYQQRPTERGKVRIFEGYTPETVTTIPDGTNYLIIDPATNHGIDFFVVGDYVYHRGHLTLVDMFAKQAAQRSEVADWINGREYAAAFMETNGVGADILEKLRERHGVRGLVGVVTSSDKYSRATTQSEDIKNYFSIYEGCNRDAVSELLTEFDTFPVSGDNIHDDLLDNVVMAFENLLRV